MTHEETVKLFGLIIVAYPNFDKFKDESHVRATVSLWDMMFADDEKWIVTLAVEKHISTSKWPPSIADIREIMGEIRTPDLMPPDEAWGLVKKLIGIRDDLYDSASNYLPSLIAEAVDVVGYKYLVNMGRAAAQGKGKEGLDRLAFIQSYEPRLRKAREQAALPVKLQDKIERAQQHFSDGTNDKVKKLEAEYDGYFNNMLFINELMKLEAPEQE